MKQIFANKDFQAWQKLTLQRAAEMEQRAAQMRQNATQENFDKLVQAHQLMSEGKTAEAQKIMQDSGMMGPGKGFGYGRHKNMMHDDNETTDNAVGNTTNSSSATSGK